MRRRLDSLDKDTWGTVFRNVILLALIGFVAMVIMLLSHITAKNKRLRPTRRPAKCRSGSGTWVEPRSTCRATT